MVATIDFISDFLNEKSRGEGRSHSIVFRDPDTEEMPSNSQDSDAKTNVAKAYSIGFGISFLISIQNQLSGEMNSLGWSTVILFAAFSIAFGKFAFKKCRYTVSDIARASGPQKWIFYCP